MSSLSPVIQGLLVSLVPEYEISNDAISFVSQFAEKVLLRLANEAARHDTRAISSSDVEAAIRIIFPGHWAASIVDEATSIVTASQNDEKDAAFKQELSDFELIDDEKSVDKPKEKKGKENIFLSAAFIESFLSSVVSFQFSTDGCIFLSSCTESVLTTLIQQSCVTLQLNTSPSSEMIITKQALIETVQHNDDLKRLAQSLDSPLGEEAPKEELSETSSDMELLEDAGIEAVVDDIRSSQASQEEEPATPERENQGAPEEVPVAEKVEEAEEKIVQEEEKVEEAEEAVAEVVEPARDEELLAKLPQHEDLGPIEPEEIPPATEEKIEESSEEEEHQKAEEPAAPTEPAKREEPEEEPEVEDEPEEPAEPNEVPAVEPVLSEPEKDLEEPAEPAQTAKSEPKEPPVVKGRLDEELDRDLAFVQEMQQGLESKQSSVNVSRIRKPTLALYGRCCPYFEITSFAIHLLSSIMEYFMGYVLLESKKVALRARTHVQKVYARAALRQLTESQNVILSAISRAENGDLFEDVLSQLSGCVHILIGQHEKEEGFRLTDRSPMREYGFEKYIAEIVMHVGAHLLLVASAHARMVSSWRITSDDVAYAALQFVIPNAPILKLVKKLQQENTLLLTGEGETLQPAPRSRIRAAEMLYLTSIIKETPLQLDNQLLIMFVFLVSLSLHTLCCVR